MATISAWGCHSSRLGLFALAIALAGTGIAVAREGPAPAAPLPIIGHHQPGPDATAAVARIRSLYETDMVIDEADPASANAWFSPGLAADMIRLYSRPGSYGIGFGYLVDGQDSELSAITYAFQNAGTDGHPAVRVRFTNFGEPIDLEFMLGDGGCIANIRSRAPDGTEKWNLHDTVIDALRDPGP
ncbi:hypothetical protein [uncultured Brevundimonas sp.]|uniref:hypothetical protein n=1 Tax=uncultured Brevundimonas sp. TaxID=213418 RepID=UPI0030EC3D50|tara:strand:- start:17818 stop:18375 length:558 start_codon:yes stop_codon:yes gene_type:complete